MKIKTVPPINKVKAQEKRLQRKKKKPGTALVLTTQQRKAVRAQFGDQSDTIIDMLENKDSDGAITLLKKRLLQTTVDLLPLAEEQVRRSESAKGIYQFVTLTSQIRELISDIQADNDRGQLAYTLDQRIIQPAFKDIAQRVILEHYDMLEACKPMLYKEHTKDFSAEIRQTAMRLAQYMQQAYAKIRQDLEEALKG